jgi:NADH:ubiquinone oxidoreductase subunit H
VYGTVLRRIVGKSKYSSLGGLRARSQSVSFEIIFSIYFLCFLFILKSFELSPLFNLSIFILFYPFIIMVLAELGRAPFDFSEGERELVSGFNTEFSRVTFVLLFLGEYGILLFFSALGSLLFFYLNFFFVILFFSLILLIRSSYPRYRYDLLIIFF